MKIPRVHITDGTEKLKVTFNLHEYTKEYFGRSTSGMMLEEYKRMMSPHDDMADAMCRCITSPMGKIILDEPKPQKRVYFSEQNPPNIGTMVYIDRNVSSNAHGTNINQKYKVIRNGNVLSILNIDGDERYIFKAALYILEGDEPEQKQGRIYFSDDNLPEVGDMIYLDRNKALLKTFHNKNSFINDGPYKVKLINNNEYPIRLKAKDGEKEHFKYYHCYILSNEVKWGVEKFEVAKWYVCRLKEIPSNWDEYGYMGKWLDGKPRKCISFYGTDRFSFDGISDTTDSRLKGWYYDKQYGDFREVPAP